jgi:predicted MFS family arabinose efflux permease
MNHLLGVILVGTALFLDTMSYWKQIRKTLKTRRSSQVSSTQYVYKIAKAFCALIGLAMYNNWVGMGMEGFMLCIYVISLVVVAHYKPKNWRLFS